ncbi:hypothetical protein [Desulfolithobacter sp.]
MGREQVETINQLVSGRGTTNYDCSSRCGRCLYRCSLFRTREYISDDRALSVFAQVKSLSCSSMHFPDLQPWEFYLEPGSEKKGR